MKIFVAHSSGYDFKNELYLPLRNSSLNKIHEIYLPQENGKQVILKEKIKEMNLIIAEVSYPSTGQGIELGWADVFRIPIVCIYKTGYKYSEAVKKITREFIEYQDTEDLITKLTIFLLKKH